MDPRLLQTLAFVILGGLLFYWLTLALSKKPGINIPLEKDERVIDATRRHWIMVARDLAIPATLTALSIFGMAYRSIGGSVFVSNPNNAGRLDLVNLFLAVAVVALLIFWRRPRKQKPKNPTPSWVYLTPIIVLVLLLLFRYSGGQVFAIDPINASGGMDLINAILFFVALIGVLWMIYVTIDWRDDALVLTNLRVVWDDEDFLLRHVQQQILLQDVRQVNVQADRYIEFLLGYGTVKVSSFSIQSIEQTFINNPKIIQDKIQKEINNLSKQRSSTALNQMVEDQVYGNKPPPAPAPAIHVMEKPGPIEWFFPRNPEIVGDTITWRPSWLYVAQIMLRPFLVLIVATIVLTILGAFNLLNDIIALVSWLPIAIVTVLWIVWVREEFMNDKYILNRKEIVDVDKRPFGPENRRRASLDSIQDISFDVNFIERLLGYGDVIIKTGGGGGDFTFNHVPDPQGVQATISDFLTDFRKNKQDAALQETLRVLKVYHDAQVAHGETTTKEQLLAALNAEWQGKMPTYEPSVNTSDLLYQTRREARMAARYEFNRLWRKFLRGRPSGTE